MADDEAEPEVQNVELARVLRNRRSEAMEAGFTLVEARMFAESEISVSVLRHLVAIHCPPELLAKIVL